MLYSEVTKYVREEWDRADALENEGRKGTVGFALTYCNGGWHLPLMQFINHYADAGSGWRKG